MQFNHDRVDAKPFIGTTARVKALHPLTSTGPSHSAEVLETSPGMLRLRVDREFLPGTSLQAILGKQILFGKVIQCTGSDNQFTLELALRDDL
jgi:hypothetical protein